MTRTDRRTLVLQLAEEGLSRRAIARRLGISKDTVRRDLEPDRAPVDEPGDEPQAADAPQVSPGEGADDAPPAAPDGAPPGAPVGVRAGAGAPGAGAPGEPVAQLPRRVAQPLGGVDLAAWPAIRRDLAVLAQAGMSAEAVVHQAVAALAHAYGQALAAGRLEPGRRFLIRGVDLVPGAALPRTPRVPVPADAGT